jgi:hypothetical protein
MTWVHAGLRFLWFFSDFSGYIEWLYSLQRTFLIRIAIAIEIAIEISISVKSGILLDRVASTAQATKHTSDTVQFHLSSLTFLSFPSAISIPISISISIPIPISISVTIDRSVVNAPLPPPQFVASSLIYRLRRWLISHAAVNNIPEEPIFFRNTEGDIQYNAFPKQ